MSLSQAQGKLGETLASQFLEKQGFSIVAKNFRWRRNEIDLIVKKERLLVFVEVKLRKNQAFGRPEDFMSPEQQERVLQAAEQYVLENDWPHDIRFDIIAITQQTGELLHLPDAFY
ncbi:YraN family protein [Cytophagales bacterium LB-30]|uniref:UPF0102 protein QWY31_10935 n=1 Tax=Shiella aurantiaca TaxID=3058365 RepID=A0ABT8F703_9BACT|nr:YraN family protein [Shiella aurantiaca]MDN4166019.1 YraN family protein [Shiella aurantiaca]